MNTQESPFGEEFKVLIQERIKHFWGYGNLNAPYWLIGMEEGYNAQTEDLYKRFKASENKVTCDVADLKIDPGSYSLFADGAPLNRTYKRLIQMILFKETGTIPDNETIRRFQIEHLGRNDSNNAILELMPLPSKSIDPSDWLYTETGIEGLSSRKDYLETYKDERIEGLRSLIEQYKPKYVICYSLSYQEDWQKLTDKPFIEVNPRRLYLAKDRETTIAITPHSVAQGLSNKDWQMIIEEMFI
jgi:hypothetical protein